MRSAVGADNEWEKEVVDQILYEAVIGEDRVSYIQEVAIPFGDDLIPSFAPDEPIGFTLSWLDWDNGVFMHGRWHQYNESDLARYGELRWNSSNPLGGTGLRHWSVY